MKDTALKNIMLFIVTVAVYWTIWFFIDPIGDLAMRTWLLALLCAPFNIGGNIWTIAGNAESETSVFAIVSFYQRAGDNATTMLGLTGYQNAGKTAFTVFGFVGYQSAGNYALIWIGIAAYQSACTEASIGLGLVWYQRAEKRAETCKAIAIYQKVVSCSERSFAIASVLKARE